MNITYHASQRFLERVIHKTKFSQYELNRAMEYLERVFEDVVIISSTKHVPLPGFENSFYAVFKENSILTIIPKNRNTKNKRTKNV